MADVTTDFADLMRAVSSGNRDALTQFCQLYEDDILRIVRLRLMRRLRSKFDSLDLVHDVWASFFADPPQQEFDGPDAVVAYMEEMARRKVAETTRQGLLQKRNLGRECPLPQPAADSVNIPIASNEPTPSEICRANEEWELLMKGRTVQQQKILRLLRNGVTQREIAERLNTNEKTIRRFVRRLLSRPNP